MKIRSDILRIYQALHTWVGIGAGMLLFIGFFAGALTMFKGPLDRWISSPAQTLQPVAQARLDPLVRQVLEQYPAARKGFTLHLEQHENVAAPLTWSGGGGREIDLSAKRWQATLDGDGKLVARQELPSLLAQLIDMLHRTGGVPGTLGDEYLGIYLMGVAGVMYFLALVSGVVLLLPTLVKDFFALRAGKNRKRFWLDAHNVVGIASLPFHVVISVTVIVFAFHDQFYDSLQEVVYGDTPMFQRGGGKPVPHAVGDMLPATVLIAKVRQAAPDFHVSEMLFMGLDGPRPMIRAAVLNPRHLVHGPESAYVMLNPYSGEVTNKTMLPGHADTWSSLVTPLFALHFGSYGGNMMRWVYFVFGLSGAFLFYSGNLLWVEKRRKNQIRDQAPPRQTRTTLRMASATLGVCLGSVAGVLLTMVAGKWLYGSAANINAAYLAVYYGVFLGAVAWAFWRGPARGAVDLLKLCALAALAIPLTSLVAVLAPSLGLWAHTSAATLGVDLTALAGAALLLYGARLTARRVLHGPLDSVWSAAVVNPGAKRELEAAA
ncbi:PepSY domain-containing protein [Rugamonas sp. DEMB1]|uniref:PepSY-associated TM helix domain-containing protein n=1 Tax=Rugamonas sp. DEMB1 TaxID=3039386 RepID=UPI002447B61C|nr:PepSY-associated TM helix domain-containing protein [Rugamonas sp. DEMB1]WGG52426.1 PepSY-associated TM helix domain-containing protein [Rugamonas sp. DEMB1]